MENKVMVYFFNQVLKAAFKQAHLLFLLYAQTSF